MLKVGDIVITKGSIKTHGPITFNMARGTVCFVTFVQPNGVYCEIASASDSNVTASGCALGYNIELAQP